MCLLWTRSSYDLISQTEYFVFSFNKINLDEMDIEKWEVYIWA